LAEEVIKYIEFLNGFRQGSIASSWKGRGGRDRGKDVWWEEVKCE